MKLDKGIMEKAFKDFYKDKLYNVRLEILSEENLLFYLLQCYDHYESIKITEEQRRAQEEFEKINKINEMAKAAIDEKLDDFQSDMIESIVEIIKGRI